MSNLKVKFVAMNILGNLISDYGGPGNLMLMTKNDGEKPAQTELWCEKEELDHQMRCK